VIVVGFVALLAAGAAAVWKLDQRGAAPRAEAPAEPVDPGAPADAPLAPLLTGAADLPPRPADHRLVGFWELRSDDARTGSMEFRADGRVIVLGTNDGVEKEPYDGKWFLMSERGDELVVELGSAAGTPGNIRVHLVLTSPDAMTAERAAFHSHESLEPQRFVRRPPAVPLFPPP
jgi:hypothetical protein